MLETPNKFNLIENYSNAKKIKKYLKDKKLNIGLITIQIISIQILILTLIILAYHYAFNLNKNNNFKMAMLVIAVLIIFFSLVKILIYIISHDKKYLKVHKMVLVEEDGRYDQQWNFKGKTSLLIGKGTDENDVDIDLSNTKYASRVSKQHAVFNFASDNWYIEDIGSANGVEIEREREKYKLRNKLEKDVPYVVNVGDIIYIGSTKLLVV